MLSASEQLAPPLFWDELKVYLGRDGICCGHSTMWVLRNVYGMNEQMNE